MNEINKFVMPEITTVPVGTPNPTIPVPGSGGATVYSLRPGAQVKTMPDGSQVTVDQNGNILKDIVE